MASGDMIEMTTRLEENEPLTTENGRSSIKMQDVPFQDSRAGSEEDMLEYEDDMPLFNCPACRRHRKLTIIEKCLIAFGVICLIVIIILAVHAGSSSDDKAPIRCETKGCLAAATSLVGAMDIRADPCEDFHQYACGGWLRETPIPPGYPIWDRFHELSYKNMYMLKDFIEAHDMHGGAQGKVRGFYSSCMAESTDHRQQTIDQFTSLIDKVTKTEPEFDLEATLMEIQKLNTWPLFRLMIGPDERNPESHIIKIEAGQSPFPFGTFKQRRPNNITERDTTKAAMANSNSTGNSTGSSMDSVSNTSSSTADVVPSSGQNVSVNGTTDDKDAGYTVVADPQAPGPTTTTPGPTTTAPHVKDTHPHPLDNVTALVRDYLKETSLLLQTLRKKTKEAADQRAQLIFNLERKLSMAHDIELHIHNRTQAYNTMTVAALQSKCNMVQWSSYLDSILGSDLLHITDKTQVVVLHEHALLQMCKIVKEYSTNDTLKSILQDYTMLAIARSFKPYFDLSTFDVNLDPDEEMDREGEHWRRCTFYTNKALGLATAAVYVNATSTQLPLTKITELINYVKKAFKEYMLRKIWMDDLTRLHAEQKIDEMIEKVSYPTFILNGTFLDEFYSQFTVGADWFENLINWRKFTLHIMMKTLDEQFNRATGWINPPVTVESDYSPVRNDIILPIALLHLPIYSHDGPSALNFGAIGTLIGHEITHAFDILGRQYDGYGRLRDWWDPITAEMFNETTPCMKDQYDHYKINNMTINGEQTLEENIADNGGLRAAYIAYQLWVNEHGTEVPLTGIDLDHKQIFYISFAQLYCSKWKEEGIKDFLVRDTHSPGPFRIQGALSNSLAFQDVFKCSYTSKYNPATKCQVW